MWSIMKKKRQIAHIPEIIPHLLTFPRIPFYPFAVSRLPPQSRSRNQLVDTIETADFFAQCGGHEHTPASHGQTHYQVPLTQHETPV